MANESSTGDYSGFEPVTGDPWYGPVPPDPWYIADGSVIDVDESFRVDMQIPVGLLELLFNERAAQAAPNDRISWRSWFPGSVIPVAMFPCTDPAKTGAVELRDVVDGLTLRSSGSGILYRRLAAGLYASDHRGRFCFNPIRGIEFTGVEESFLAEDNHSLDPPVTSKTSNALSGLVIARLREPGLLMKKLLVTEEPAGAYGWSLEVTSAGKVRLTYYNGTLGGDYYVEVDAAHDTQHWFATLFSIEYWDDDPGADPPVTGGVKLRIFTPHGYFLQNVAGQYLNATPHGIPSVAPWSYPELPLPVIDAPFTLGGAVGQIALASYWQGTADKYQLATSNNFHRLWRGTVFPANVAEEPGIRLWRDKVMAWKSGESLGNGDVVARYSPGFIDTGTEDVPDVVPQDPFEDTAGERALPHDKERTNLVEFSENFSEWDDGGGPGSGPSGPTVTGPDGMNSAFELPCGDHVGAPNSVLAAVPAYTFSVWARSRNGGSATLNLGATGPEMPWNLSRRWQRISVSGSELDIGDDVTPRITAGGAAGASVELWGAQLEVGTAPTAYIPTTDDAVTARFTTCRADWGVLPGPPADHGKVQVVLTAKEELVDDIGESYAAFEFGYGVDTFLRVWGSISSDGDEKRFITWKAGGQLWDGGASFWTVSPIAAEPLEFKAGQPLTVALAWNRRGIEFWVEGKLAARGGPPSDHPEYPVRFEAAPEGCDLMRDGTHLKWIGACKELRWWR